MASFLCPLYVLFTFYSSIVLCGAQKVDKNEYYPVNIRRVPMMRLELLSEDEAYLKREMTNSSSIFSLEMSLDPFHKRWIQFAVVLLWSQPWKTTSADITCPGKGGVCSEEDVLRGRQLHIQLTKTSDCVPTGDPKPFKLKYLKLYYTIKDQRNQWRSVEINLSDVQVEDPCNVNAQPSLLEANPTFVENIDCASTQSLTKADPFRGFYIRDGENVNTTWCEHTCTCRNGLVYCKQLECSIRYNPNTHRSVSIAGECCQVIEKRDQFDLEQCKSDPDIVWPTAEDPQRSMLAQLFRMPLWTVPYVVFHRPSYVSICMASFIHKRWMVTPANCLFNDGRAATVRQIIFGTTFFRLRVKRIITHPDFQPTSVRSPVGDISLFEMETDQPFGSLQEQVNLPSPGQCGEFLRSKCPIMTSVYGNDVSEYLFGMSARLGIRSTRFPFPRHVIARLTDVEREEGNFDDYLIKVSFTDQSHRNRAGIPIEAGCVSADGSALVMRQGWAYYLVGMVTANEKGTLGSSTADSMCHEADTDVVTICPYLDWIKLIMSLPNQIVN